MHRQPDGLWLYSPRDLISWLEGDFAAWCERLHAERRGGDAAISSPLQPDSPDDELALAVRYGMEHERSHLERLQSKHPDLIEIAEKDPDRVGRTAEAMTSGAPVIFQGMLAADGWNGIADFLHRTDTHSELGKWSYQPWDTKLARTARPYFLLQLCAYAAMLESFQGVRPDRLGFVLGDLAEQQFRTDDFWHYFDRLRQRFVEFQHHWNPDAIPDPSADRSHGRWSEAAARILEQRDDLSLVAGIARTQVIRLREAGITTLADLAGATQAPKGIAAASFTRIRDQAQMQVRSRNAGELAWRLRTPDADDPRRGLMLLPPPSPLDVFYDIEGFPYAADGLEYLHGATTVEPDGSLAFDDWWAHDEASEKLAFENFVDWAWQRWQRDPAMHIHHYAGYERTALSRLSIKYATREQEIDEFLRKGVLVDLFTVVRQGMVIGAPSYSLKDIEQIYLPPRDGEVTSAGGSVVEYQRWIDSGESPDWRSSPILAAIRDYNRVDCESTAQLRNWLLERQREAGVEWRSAQDTGDAPKLHVKSAAELLAEELLQRAETLPEGEQRITRLLAWLLEFHRRDDKPMWWRYFNRLAMDEQELYDDPDCLAGLVRTDREPWPEAKSLVYQFRFDPEQETKFHQGSKVAIVSDDTSNAEIDTFDPVAGLLTIKRRAGSEMPTQGHLIPYEYVSPGEIPDSIERYVRGWDAGSPATAIDDLLNRRPPRLAGRDGGRVVAGVDLVGETIAAVRAMQDTVLAIQGPPGTGKTHTAAHVIAALLDDGQRIGVVANSHAVVNNLLVKLASVAPRHAGKLIKVGDSDAPDCVRHLSKPAEAVHHLDMPVVLGGTAWLFSREVMQDKLDYLFVDEAGQMSLANTIGSGMAARNIVLVGDQMQLPQVAQGAHPGESGMSCLEYFLHGHQTVPPDMGVLLDRSYRMHLDLCRFISEAYYEGRLKADDSTRNNGIEWNGPPTGVHFVPVEHEGCAQSSEEEVREVRALVDRLLGQKAVIGDQPRVLGAEDILVVAPFNAQVRALMCELPDGIRVGTVDRFQGQQAPVVIVSMSASSLDDAPRGADFLLSPNRLNVALSRAQALAIVVAAPGLGDVRVRSIKEMRLVNGWCRI
ncbi:MAG TPA: TM0106 family RecB-like putative nuclease, partial [Gemmatimonadales bacterium]|nr:TM0106 family RecB-like putative nuclease [Gemmatimonadales bacterium]